MEKLDYITTLSFIVSNRIDEIAIKAIIKINRESTTSRVILWYDEEEYTVYITGYANDVFETEKRWYDRIKHALHITD